MKLFNDMYKLKKFKFIFNGGYYIEKVNYRVYVPVYIKGETLPRSYKKNKAICNIFGDRIDSKKEYYNTLKEALEAINKHRLESNKGGEKL